MRGGMGMGTDALAGEAIQGIGAGLGDAVAAHVAADVGREDDIWPVGHQAGIRRRIRG